MGDQKKGGEWHLQETYKGLIQISIECLKILALVNGGAAIAAMTFLGVVATRDDLKPSLHGVASGISWFSYGLVLAMICFIGSYITQLRLFQEERDNKTYKFVPNYHAIILHVTILLACISVFCFVNGCSLIASAVLLIKI